MLLGSYMTAIADKLKIELSAAYDIDLIHFHSQEQKETPFIYPIRTKIETLVHLIEAFKTGPEPVKIDSDVLMELSTKELRTPRDLMQEVGMFIRNIFGKDIHLKHLNLDKEITIVSDLRFKNEFDYLEKMEKKGYLHLPLYIQNYQAENSGDTHISEQEFRKFSKKCIKIDNNDKDIEFLADQLEEVFRANFE